MVPEQSVFAGRIALGLMALATIGVELAATDSRSPWQSLAWTLGWCLIAAIGSRLAPRPQKSQTLPPFSVTLALGLFAFIPFLVEPVRRWAGGEGFPLEIQILFALRNLGLGLAACACWVFCMRLACVVSLFLTLFTSTMTSHPIVLGLMGAYVALGSVWLMLVYWSRLGGRVIATDDAVSLQVGSGRTRLPWWTLSAAVGFIALSAGLVAIGPHQAIATLWELVPTSGGTGEYDPYARGGVNDGDQETRGNNANSTGTIETDQFLDSPLPSLYDMVNDMFGEPFKTIGQERSIALQPNQNARETTKTPADNLRPNRQFSTHRKGPPQAREAQSQDARGIFEIEGPTPLCIRVAVYDRFDGVAWSEAPYSDASVPLEKLDRSNGFRLLWDPPSSLRGLLEIEPRTHRIVVTESFGSLIPTPAQTTRFKVGRVDQADFFAWSQEGILRFAQRSTPSGIAIDCVSHLFSERSLAKLDFNARINTPPEWLQLPAAFKPKLDRLGLEWTLGATSSWTKIAAVVHHLRTEYTYDPLASAPEGHPEPLERFLFEEKRGPDYLFASSAVLLLRSLGQPARLACGFYASPEKYDPASGHTPVTAADLHFWPEVRLPWGDWLPLEPTPGFIAAVPQPPLVERIFLAVQSIGAWAWNFKWFLVCGAALSALAFAMRKRIEDRFWILWFTWFPGRDEKQKIHNALWLFERRSRWMGLHRARGQTVEQWLMRWKALTGSNDFGQFTRWVHWASYAPEREPAPEAEGDPSQKLIRGWTWVRCAQTLRQRELITPKGPIS